MKHIFIVDDDVAIGSMLEEALVRDGYCVTRAYSGTEALLALEKERPDLVLLDLMLPGLSGEDVLPRLTGIPVIVMSAKADSDHAAELLWGGAADYVYKPFSLRELLARIALRLRDAPDTPGVLAFAGLALDTSTRSVQAQGNTLHLTRTEYAILKLLVQNPTAVVTKSAVLERISADTPDCTEISLKMHVSNLRRKLREATGHDYIEAVWGVGFKLREPEKT